MCSAATLRGKDSRHSSLLRERRWPSWRGSHLSLEGNHFSKRIAMPGMIAVVISSKNRRAVKSGCLQLSLQLGPRLFMKTSPGCGSPRLAITNGTGWNRAHLEQTVWKQQFQFGSNLTSREKIHSVVLYHSCHILAPPRSRGGSGVGLANTCDWPRLVTVLLRAALQKAAKVPTYKCFAIDMKPVGISCLGPFLIANGSCVTTPVMSVQH